MTPEKKSETSQPEELSETALRRVAAGAPRPRQPGAWLGPERPHPIAATRGFSVDQDLDQPDMAAVPPK